MAGASAETNQRILGLTGPIGCGKTTVGGVLLRLGALARIDADAVVHELMAPGMDVTARIAEVFGPAVLAENGAVNRTQLAEIVFADPAKLRTLEEIVHPGVRATIQRRLQDLAGRAGIVVVDAVRLLQSELLPFCETVWVVRCTPDQQMHRLTVHRGMSSEAARARIDAQPSFQHSRVDRVIENSGSIDDLANQVKNAWRTLTEQASADL